MKDYTATFELSIPYQARNDAQAEERASQLEELLEIKLSKHPKWVGDLELSQEGQED